ncbi:hypothetical protein [Phytoactinopolyspora mesophila]|uniref:Uncharacterized protein n=1 Tax=Phytoactinopolyspora mesophila TaxID=2650750 RepID=A0A7K3MA03_9ACTN|nr:hypothetical protein [Phytoactinopolyspora mesophila]NDL59228.1 hypothetical protein [Phytoactinopolyspora mesophila]
MVSTDDALPIVSAGVVLLIGLCLTIAWIPARGRYPGGLPARVAISLGVAAIAWEPVGLGVLGAVLSAMGVAIWWAGRPEPELPRPRRRGLVIAAVVSGLLVLASLDGWGPFARVHEDIRAIATVFVVAVCLLGTLAVADRARVTFRDALRRRIEQSSQHPTMSA